MIIRILELIYYQDGQGHGVKNTLGTGIYQIIQQPLFYLYRLVISQCLFLFLFILFLLFIRKVHKYGKSTTGESWDIVVNEETYYK